MPDSSELPRSESNRPHDAEVRSALAQVTAALEENRARTSEALAKVDALLAAADEGRPWDELFLAEPQPLLVEVLTESIQAVMQATSRYRRAEAQVLHRTGSTMERIAELFGVTRQRVSHLLRTDTDD